MNEFSIKPGPEPTPKEAMKMRERLTNMGTNFPLPDFVCGQCGDNYDDDPHLRLLKILVGLLPPSQLEAVHDQVMKWERLAFITKRDGVRATLRPQYRVDLDGIWQLEKFVANQFPEEGGE
jgi:hypothetical protein